jgi:hypothetical protein
MTDLRRKELLLTNDFGQSWRWLGFQRGGWRIDRGCVLLSVCSIEELPRFHDKAKQRVSVVFIRLAAKWAPAAAMAKIPSRSA